MKLTDFPPHECAELFYSIVERFNSSKERHEFTSLKSAVYLTIDDARRVWAAGKWMERYHNWASEATKAKGKVGVYPAEYDLTQCQRFIAAKVDEMSKLEEKMLILTEREMVIVDSAARHLDHYALITSFEIGRKNWKGKR